MIKEKKKINIYLIVCRILIYLCFNLNCDFSTTYTIISKILNSLKKGEDAFLVWGNKDASADKYSVKDDQISSAVIYYVKNSD